MPVMPRDGALWWGPPQVAQSLGITGITHLLADFITVCLGENSETLRCAQPPGHLAASGCATPPKILTSSVLIALGNWVRAMDSPVSP